MIPYLFYGSVMYRKHPKYTYGRNWNNSANNQAKVDWSVKIWGDHGLSNPPAPTALPKLQTIAVVLLHFFMLMRFGQITIKLELFIF